MIETPVTAQRGPLAAPPPDPRSREPDPPPDPLSRYEHACVECGAPVHADQAACLNCGTMVEQGDGGAGIRRAALGSVTALLVLGGAVGAAVAGLPHGKDVPKPAEAHVFGTKKTPPPATAGSNGTQASPTTRLPGGDTAAKPPPIEPVTPSKTGGAGKNTGTKSTGAIKNTPSGSSSGGKKSGGKKGGKKNGGKPHKSLKLFTTGLAPVGAEEFTSSGSHSTSPAADRTADTDAKTAWTTKSAGHGILIQPNSGPWGGLGIVSSTPHYGVKVYYTNESTPPADLTAWKQVGSTTDADARQRFSFSGGAKNADEYLVFITGVPGGGKVSINEIQLLP
jgi:hypothetical protein